MTDKGPITESELATRFRRLSAQLDGLKPASDKPGPKGSRGADYSKALRLSSEFVAAILVGAGLGWGLDRLAGTAPWGMIVLLLLGFAAGVINVIRSAGEMKSGAAPPDGDGGRSG